MSAAFASWSDETFDLAALQVTVGLDRDQDSRLRSTVRAEELEELEFVTAAIHLAALEDVQSPPEALLERLRGDAQHWAPPPRLEAAAPAPFRLMTYTGWMAAAAVLLVFLLGRGEPTQVEAPGLDALVASAPSDLVRLDWAITEDPLAAEASGEVLWSSERQEGYMVFNGLAPNDPSESQYQLWVFDPTRADWENKPVDGGVFDVSPDGTVVVPIDPKLEVRETALFAVTLEVPGGVVVSEREHLVLTAAP